MDTDHTDNDLVLRLRRGDAASLGAVLDRFWTPLVSYVATLGVDHDTAEDVAQQAFVRLWERREQLKLEGSLRGLVYRIARNLCFDEQRRVAARDRCARQTAAGARTSDPYAGLLAGELRAIVESAVSALPKRRREVFILARYQGLSHREVAEILDLSPQTVANHLGMALADLRVLLAPYLPDYYCSSVPTHHGLETPTAVRSLRA